MPSEVARLEVDILQSEQPPRETSAAADSAAPADVPILLVIAADADVRSYIGSCLAGIGTFTVLQASSWRHARSTVSGAGPQLVVVEAPDAPAAEALLTEDSGDDALATVPCVLILDDRSNPAAKVMTTGPTVLIAKPFNAQRLTDAVLGLYRSDG